MEIKFTQKRMLCVSQSLKEKKGNWEILFRLRDGASVDLCGYKYARHIHYIKFHHKNY